jgi:FlaA1/EpsC-like NDP-sugar epimerase
MYSLSWSQATRENIPAQRTAIRSKAAARTGNKSHVAEIWLAAFSVFNVSIAFLLSSQGAPRWRLIAAVLTASLLAVGIRHLPRNTGGTRAAPARRSTPRLPAQPARDFERFPFANLLGREEVRANHLATRELVEGKVVCVTGAGGSIGSALCKEIAAADPRALLLLDKSENGLFYSHLACSQLLEASRVSPYLADIVDCAPLFGIFDTQRPEIVFHTAAHKHVGILERCPAQAIHNNLLGTRNVALAAIASRTDHFVNVSTDKAVEPTSYMGLSKKLAEATIRELAGSNPALGTCLSNVRFGNVAGSTGSVMRLFLDQMQAGGPVCVTDPRASRYFMSIAEAVHLIIHAAILGTRGETYVFDMGAPRNIHEIAKSMIAMKGLSAGHEGVRQIDIQFTGLGPAEKIEELLWEDCEKPQTTRFERILAIPAKNSRSLGVLSQLNVIESYIHSNDVRSLLACIHDLVPEFLETRRPAPGVIAERQIAEVA